VIKIQAVQCHRAAITDDDTTQFLFFVAGCRPKLTGNFHWSLDAPEQDFPGAPSGAPFDLVLNLISLPMQLAWDAAIAAFNELIKAIQNGEWIASGVHPVTGVRHDLDPAEWTREGLILDVRNGDLFEGHYTKHVRRSSNGDLIEGRNTTDLRWSTITLRAAEPLRTAAPERKLGKIDWDDWWKHEEARKQQGLLPNKKAYLAEAEQFIKERYGVRTVPLSELRRYKAALYRGDSQRPKRPKRKKPEHKV
jgi:hypothetical protein